MTVAHNAAGEDLASPPLALRAGQWPVGKFHLQRNDPKNTMKKTGKNCMDTDIDPTSMLHLLLNLPSETVQREYEEDRVLDVRILNRVTSHTVRWQ